MSPRTAFGKTFLRVRIAIYLVVLALSGFFLLRFDLVSLPAEGCSPLLGIAPGDRLIVDRHPSAIQLGDGVLYRSPAGELLLGRVDAPPPSAPASVFEACRAGDLWIVTEDPACSTADSTRFGPISRAALVGRIRGVLPW